MTDLRSRLQTSLGSTYTIERELGGGGMSRVFEATESSLGRSVVVKLLTPELAADVSTERFAREVKLAARLQHANIVPLLNAGEALGLPYYTMPFVRGETLRSRLGRGPFSGPEATSVLRDIARALAYAHAQGVVHRDIKPENVLLSGGAAMVADFGIAKAVNDARTQGDDASITITQVGHSPGTPAYMAPEQAAGDPRTDHRADLYAWGVIAYELLAGEHPFVGATSVHAMIAAHMAQTAAPIATRRPDVPDALGVIVMRCLAKEASHRPQAAAELLEALDGLSTPVSTTSPSPLSRVPLLSKRARVLVGGATLVMFATTAWYFSIRSDVDTSTTPDSPVTSLVVLPFESVGGDTANAYFAEGMADEVSNALAKVAGLQIAGRGSALAFQGRHVAAQEVGNALGVGAVLEGTVRRAGDKLRVSTQLTNAASGLVIWSEVYERELKDVFAVQDDIRNAIVSALRGKLAGADTPADGLSAAYSEAYDLYLRGMYFYQRRGPGLARAVDYFQQAIAKDPTLARAHAGLGMTWIQMAVYTDTPLRELLAKAQAEGERALSLDSASADAWVALGLVHTYAHRWNEAEAAFHRAIQFNDRLSSAHFWYARLLGVTGRVNEAVTEMTQAKALDPMNAATLGVSALTLSIAGRHAEAMADGERAWELDSTISATQSYSLIALLNGGRGGDALKRADGILRASNDMTARSTAAYIVGATGDTSRAAALGREIAATYPRHARINSSLTRVWLGAGDSARALQTMEAAVRLLETGVVNMPLSERQYDRLRASPHFAAVVRSLGLDVARFTSPNGGRPQ